MNDIVVIKVVPNVAPLELAVVIVGVHLLSHGLVQGVVKEAKEFSSLLWSEIEHKDEPGHVGKSKHGDNSVYPLHELILLVLQIRFEVSERAHE